MGQHSRADDDLREDAGRALEECHRREALLICVLGLKRCDSGGYRQPHHTGSEIQEQAGRRIERAEPEAVVDREWQEDDPEHPDGPLPGNAHVIQQRDPSPPRRRVAEEQRPQVHPLKLHPPLRPALLLRLVGGVGGGQLTRHDDLFDELRPVSRKQVAEAQFAVLDQTGRLPAAHGLDRRGSPNPSRPGEIHELPHRRAPRHLQGVMIIDPQRLRERERRLLVVEMSPLRLHQRQTCVRRAVFQVEVRDRAQQVIARRHKVGIEDDEELTVRLQPTCLKRPSLVALAVGAVECAAVDPLRPYFGANLFDQAAGIVVGGVVEHLNGEAVSRPFHVGRGLDDTAGNCVLVEHRKLHANRRVFLRHLPRHLRLATFPVKAEALHDPENLKEHDHQEGDVKCGGDHQPDRRAQLIALVLRSDRDREHDECSDSQQQAGIDHPPPKP